MCQDAAFFKGDCGRVRRSYLKARYICVMAPPPASLGLHVGLLLHIVRDPEFYLAFVSNVQMRPVQWTSVLYPVVVIQHLRT